MDPEFVVEVKRTIFWLNRGWRIYLDWYAAEFSEKYLQVIIMDIGN